MRSPAAGKDEEEYEVNEHQLTLAELRRSKVRLLTLCTGGRVDLGTGFWVEEVGSAVDLSHDSD